MAGDQRPRHFSSRTTSWAGPSATALPDYKMTGAVRRKDRADRGDVTHIVFSMGWRAFCIHRRFWTKFKRRRPGYARDRSISSKRRVVASDLVTVLPGRFLPRRCSCSQMAPGSAVIRPAAQVVDLRGDPCVRVDAGRERCGPLRTQWLQQGPPRAGCSGQTATNPRSNTIGALRGEKWYCALPKMHRWGWPSSRL